MNFTRSTYYLIAVAMLIWGGFIYLVVTDRKEVEAPIDNSYLKNLASTKEQKSDTFSLLLSYRDPFLSNAKSLTPSKTTIVQKAEPKKIPVPIQIIPWPSIRFSGIIKNQKSNKTVAMLTANSQSFLLSQGDIFFKEYTLSRITNDSVEVTKQKEKRIFKRL